MSKKEIDRHPTSLLQVTIRVDTEIAPLVQECWRLGWQTMYCCQGGTRGKKDERAYIMFVNDHAAMFAQTVALYWEGWPHFVRVDANGSVIRFAPELIHRLTEILVSILPDTVAHAPVRPGWPGLPAKAE